MNKKGSIWILFGFIAVVLLVLGSIAISKANYEKFEDEDTYECYERIARKICAERGLEFKYISRMRDVIVCSPDARRKGSAEYSFNFLPEDERKCSTK